MRYGYACLLVGMCLMLYGAMSGSAVSYSEVQKNNNLCLCCACEDLNQKHPYSIEEAQVAAALLSLPFEYAQADKNNQKTSTATS